MNDIRLKRLLRDSIMYEKAEAEKTAELLSRDIGNKNKNRLSVFTRLKNVLSNISFLFWLVQALFFLIFIFIDHGKFSILPLIPIVAVTALCEILKNAYFDMWELERACKYDLRSLLIFKLLITGTVDFLLVTAAVAFGGSDVSELLYSAAIYVFTCVLCLTFFRLFRNKSLIFVFSVTGIILSLTVYALMNIRSIDIFSGKYLHWWCICLAVFVFLYFVRIKRILRTEDVYEGR